MKLIQTAVVLVLILSSCSVLGPNKSEPRTYYVLEPAECTAEKAASPRPSSILIGDTTATRLVDSQRILYSREAPTRGLYQFAYWLESPAVRFSNLLLSRLECLHLFKNQTRNSTISKADYVLSAEIIDFFHDVSVTPSVSRVHLRAELLDLKSRKIAASHTFSRDITLSQADAANAVEGFNRAVNEIITEIVAWLETQIPAQ